jgi:hypothetical protein
MGGGNGTDASVRWAASAAGRSGADQAGVEPMSTVDRRAPASGPWPRRCANHSSSVSSGSPDSTDECPPAADGSSTAGQDDVVLSEDESPAAVHGPVDSDDEDHDGSDDDRSAFE